MKSTLVSTWRCQIKDNYAISIHDTSLHDLNIITFLFWLKYGDLKKLMM